jgi:hypothetical protein
MSCLFFAAERRITLRQSAAQAEAHFDMRKIHTSLNLPSGGGRVVVFDRETISGQRENLACFDVDGHTKWTAKLPTSDPTDCFIAVRMDGDLVLANSFSCYTVWLDAATGRTIRAQFTK